MHAPNKQKAGPSVWSILLWGALSWMVLFGWWSFHLSPGVGDVMTRAVLPGAIASIIFTPVLFLWLGLVMLGFWACKCRRGGPRAYVMLGPLMVWALILTWQSISDPPSPFRFFKERTNVELPQSTHHIRMRGQVWQDGGNMSYYFRANEPEVRLLIQRLGAREIDDGEGYAVESVTIHFDSFAGAPLPPADAKVFHARTGKTGATIELITDASMTEVWLVRTAGGSKTDEELGPEAVAAMNTAESR